jgi:hypothetical protein
VSGERRGGDEECGRAAAVAAAGRLVVPVCRLLDPMLEDLLPGDPRLGEPTLGRRRSPSPADEAWR